MEAESTGTKASSAYVPCGSNPAAPWLCLYTRPQAERVALQNLRQQGFPAFLPLYLATRANRTTSIDPLFPRYIFAQAHDGSWSAMRGTRGVVSVLRDAVGEARHVPSLVVSRLLAQCAANGVVYPVIPDEIETGDNVRVTTGPFAEFAGICRRTAKDRVWLLLEILGRPTEIAFDRAVLEPA